MISLDALKKKVDELQKQAEKIEELGIQLLEGAYKENSLGTGSFPLLDSRDPLSKVQREAILKYQDWYSTALYLVDQYTPEWLGKFTSHYTSGSSGSRGVMDYLRLGISTPLGTARIYGIHKTKSIADFVSALVTQAAIVVSIPQLMEVQEMSLRKLINAEVARTQIEEAEILLASGFERAAGSIAGVALELHLKTLCDVNGVSYPPKPTIEPLAQVLYDAKKLDKTEVKYIQYLASIRNKCSHPEPVSAKEIQSLIDGVKKLV